ncbi:hypothetical protein TREES_T100012128 [Tupaia chinensis]|uniref:Uncharacterized protein n=1 Tax=Tupaia chinensis TaxID=246437 RepID=L9JZP6_TUPCH|nr:hypothetical protein TREES_T100012128 [Tupaia chinensis]
MYMGHMSKKLKSQRKFWKKRIAKEELKFRALADLGGQSAWVVNRPAFWGKERTVTHRPAAPRTYCLSLNRSLATSENKRCWNDE